MAPKKAYHHGDLRQACIDAAVELIEKQGTEFSLRDVARRLNVSHGAPYKHFETKEALLAAIAEDGFKKFRECLVKAADAKTDKVESFKAMGRAYIEFASTHPNHFQVMFTLQVEKPECYPGLEEVGFGSFKVLLDAVCDMQKDGHYQGMSGLHASVAIWSMVHGFSSLLINGRLKPEVFGSIEDQMKAVERVLELGSKT